MSSIRIKFIRGEEVKYISHLDLMKVFERALRRANLPIAYSQGFNPHPQMVFGLPLSVGVTSEAEYADFDLTEDIEPEKFAKILNGSLPRGLSITGAKYLRSKSNIMKEIAFSSYDVLVSPAVDVGIHDMQEKLQQLLNQDEINVIKEGKKGARELDIKPLIHGLKAKLIKNDELEIMGFGNTSIIPENSCSWVKQYVDAVISSGIKNISYKADSLLIFSMLISAGSTANLKPELFIQAINNKYELNLKVIKIHRIGLYVNKKGEVTDPLDEAALSSIV